MRTNLKFLSTLCLLFFAQIIFAQVSGTVYGADGSPEPDAMVKVVETGAKTITDLDGNFSIDAKIGQTLEVSGDQLETRQFPISNAKLSIKMNKSQQLETVTVVGFGRKETTAEKTGAYNAISNLESTPVLSVDQALMGNLAGVSTATTSGQPGANVAVFLRGISSLTQSTQPLFIIDGVAQITGDISSSVSSSNALAGLNPNDIEEVLVLKDAISTAVYGSRGTNGVIIIKTKSGKGLKPKFVFTSSYGFSKQAFNELDFLNAREHIELFALGQVNAGLASDMAAGRVQAIDFYDWDGVTDTDWRKAVLRNSANTQSYSIQAMGGSDLSKYFFSLGYDNFEGLIKSSGMQRLSSTINFDIKASERLNLSFKGQASRSEQEGPMDATFIGNPIFAADVLSPTQPIYNSDGSYNLGLAFSGAANSGAAWEDFNPVGLLETNIYKSNQTRISASLGGDYKLSNSFGLRSSINVYSLMLDDLVWQNPDFGDGVGGTLGDGSGTKTSTIYSTWNWQGFVTYKRNFAEKHMFNADLGIEALRDAVKSTYAYGEGYAYGRNLAELTNAAEAGSVSSRKYGSTIVGYIATLNYIYDNKYTISGSARVDGSSVFGPDNRYGLFWAAGAGWNIEKEAFMQKYSFVNELKLRGSYGFTGNTPDAKFGWFARVNTDQYAGGSGFRPVSVDPALGWETQAQLNVGIDFSFFNKRVFGNFDYFEKSTIDLLLDVPNPASAIGNTGTSGTSILSNAGDLSNKGIEVSLGAIPVKSDNFEWEVKVNYAHINSTVEDLPLGQDILINGSKRLSIGHNPSEWYMRLWAGVDPTNGNPLWYLNQERTLTTSDPAAAPLLFTGENAIPTHTASLTNTFTYKNFKISLMLNYMGDYSVFNNQAFTYDASGRFVYMNHLAGNLYDSWTPENIYASNPRYVNNNPLNSGATSTRFLYNGDHIRLKNVEIGYNFTKDFLSINEINSIYVFFRGSNLATWVFDKSLQIDPESASNGDALDFSTAPYLTPLEGAGIYEGTSPIMKTYTFGVRVNF